MGFGGEILQWLSERSVWITSRQILKSIQKDKSMQGSRINLKEHPRNQYEQHQRKSMMSIPIFSILSQWLGSHSLCLPYTHTVELT